MHADTILVLMNLYLSSKLVFALFMLLFIEIFFKTMTFCWSGLSCSSDLMLYCKEMIMYVHNYWWTYNKINWQLFFHDWHLRYWRSLLNIACLSIQQKGDRPVSTKGRVLWAYSTRLRWSLKAARFWQTRHQVPGWDAWSNCWIVGDSQRTCWWWDRGAGKNSLQKWDTTVVFCGFTHRGNNGSWKHDVDSVGPGWQVNPVPYLGV